MGYPASPIAIYSLQAVSTRTARDRRRATRTSRALVGHDLVVTDVFRLHRPCVDGTTIELLSDISRIYAPRRPRVEWRGLKEKKGEKQIGLGQEAPCCKVRSFVTTNELSASKEASNDFTGKGRS